jgi:hypothetical protein
MVIGHSNMQGNVSPAKAEEWLTLNAFPNQRPLKVKHRDFLANEIFAGRFIQGTQIHFVVFGKKKFLVNGQHTLSAILKTGITVLLAVLTTTVDSMEEVVKIYLGHDPKGTGRSTLTAHAWNAFYAGKKIKTISITGQEQLDKIRIAGTTYTGDTVQDEDTEQ